jgi:GST-like protein
MEVKRQLDVLDQQLAQHEFIAGDEYTIADMAIWPWYGVLVQSKLYEAGEFLDVTSYTNVVRWADQLGDRVGVKRGRIVNRVWGEENEKLANRHSAKDIDEVLAK